MRNHKKAITTLLTAVVLLITVLMTGCSKLSESPNSTPSEIDTPAEANEFGVYIKLERDDAKSILGQRSGRTHRGHHAGC